MIILFLPLISIVLKASLWLRTGNRSIEARVWSTDNRLVWIKVRGRCYLGQVWRSVWTLTQSSQTHSVWIGNLFCKPQWRRKIVGRRSGGLWLTWRTPPWLWTLRKTSQTPCYKILPTLQEENQQNQKLSYNCFILSLQCTVEYLLFTSILREKRRCKANLKSKKPLLAQRFHWNQAFHKLLLRSSYQYRVQLMMIHQGKKP